jgi:signal peptidase II
MTPKLKYFLAVFLVTLPLDQISKQWIIANIHYGEVVPVIPGFFEITQVRNPGGAFSFFASGSLEHRMYFFIGMGALAIGLLLLFLHRLEPHARLASIALGGILGGAIGNLIDRIAYHEVIDFINIHLSSTYIWPTFNFADSFIVVGVGLLLAEVFFAREDDAESHPTRDDSPDSSQVLSQ